jgi:hypothetical protein
MHVGKRLHLRPAQSPARCVAAKATIYFLTLSTSHHQCQATVSRTPASTSMARTFASSWAKSFVAARPMPDGAPVITATLPNNLVNFSLFFAHPPAKKTSPYASTTAHGSVFASGYPIGGISSQNCLTQFTLSVLMVRVKSDDAPHTTCRCPLCTLLRLWYQFIFRRQALLGTMAGVRW